MLQWTSEGISEKGLAIHEAQRNIYIKIQSNVWVRRNDKEKKLKVSNK